MTEIKNEICVDCKNAPFSTCKATWEQVTLDAITRKIVDCDEYEKDEPYHLKITIEYDDKIAVMEKDVKKLPKLKWKSKNAAGYGEFKNVKLTDEEIKKLQRDYPSEYADVIEALSEYLETKGKRYKSHYAVIKSWIRRDRKEKAEREELNRKREDYRKNRDKLRSKPSYDLKKIIEDSMNNTEI